MNPYYLRSGGIGSIPEKYLNGVQPFTRQRGNVAADNAENAEYNMEEVFDNMEEEVDMMEEMVDNEAAVPQPDPGADQLSFHDQFTEWLRLKRLRLIDEKKAKAARRPPWRY